MRKMMKRLGISAGLVLVALVLWSRVFAAADLNLQGTGGNGDQAHPFDVISVTTSAVVKIVMPDNDALIAHLGIQDDGSTASDSTDYVVIMRDKDENGTAVTMAANYSDGVKLIVKANGAATFRARRIPDGADGVREVQIKAVGHGAKLQVIRGVPAK